MSKEQANTFKKFKEADDQMGNLGWASKLSKKALRQAQEAPEDIERTFAFSDDERLLWRLLKLPRKYTDLENAGVLPADKVRGVMRGLVSADMLDIVDATDGKPIVPMEVNRLKRAIAGKDEKVEVKKKSIDERVFRPSIGLASEAPPPSSGDADGASATTSAPPPKEQPAAKAPAPAPAATKLSLDDQKVKERIVREHTERLKGNHYTVLGVPQTASAADIKKAYVTLAREWHPDSLSGTPLADDDVVKVKLAELFGRLQDANAILSHADERAAYDRSGASVVTHSGGKKIRRTAEANVAFVKAETYFKKKDWRLAEVHYRLASDLDEEDPKFRVLLAWAIFHNEAKDKIVRTTEAKKLLADIYKAHKIADAAYKLGLIARQDGDEVEAMKRFDEAYRLDPKNPEIQRERRLKEMRADKEKTENDSLLGRFKKLTR